MSNHKYDSDGFQIVASKKSFKNKSTKVPRQSSDFLKSKSFNIDIEKSYKKIISAVDVLKDCQFSKDLIKSV
ncbi:unnamed protein product [Pieris brassicae]|uniref:Uncharacterized protein n=1 Tax=Pieris brassicae TaxID=7116 RepID=A0A9P0TT53_PIEBR|nr:unnamed protein product [Pieris brassicae]